VTRWITPRLSRSLSLRYWHFSLRCTTRPQPDVEGDSPSSHARSEPICNRIILAKHRCRRRTEQFQWVLALLVAVCRSGKVSLALLLHWKELQLLCVVVVLSLKVFLALFRRLRDRAAAPSKEDRFALCRRQHTTSHDLAAVQNYSPSSPGTTFMNGALPLRGCGAEQSSHPKSCSVQLGLGVPNRTPEDASDLRVLVAFDFMQQEDSPVTRWQFLDRARQGDAMEGAGDPLVNRLQRNDRI